MFKFLRCAPSISLRSACLLFSVFSCDFDPEELPPLPGPRLQLHGKRDECLTPEYGRTASLTVAEDQHRITTVAAARQQVTECNEVLTANTGRDPPHASSVLENQSRRCHQLEGSEEAPRVGNSAEESRSRERQQQLMLERLWRGPETLSGLSQVQTELPQRISVASGTTERFRLEQATCSGSTESQRQLDTELERRRWNCSTVPPFIIRKRSHVQHHSQAAAAPRCHSLQSLPQHPGVSQTPLKEPQVGQSGISAALPTVKGEHTH